MLTYLAIFTIPVIYLAVEEWEGRQANPSGPKLLVRLIRGFRQKLGWLIGSCLGGVAIALWRDNWDRGATSTVVMIACGAMLAIHDAVRSLKEDDGSKKT